MFDDAQRKQCDHATEIVAFLYGECDERQRVAFESHLADCSACAEDLSAFSALHVAMSDERERALGSMPPIRIDVAQDERANGFFETFWEMISGSRMLVASSAFAAVLVGVISLVLIYGPKTGSGVEIASNTSPVSNQSIQQTSPEPAIGSSPNPEERIETEREKDFSVGERTERSRTASTGPTVAQPQKRKAAPTGKAPTLSSFDEDVEDTSLRLSDLFGESGD